jgi:hypothetical protein
MHCPPRQRDRLQEMLVPLYPARVIDVREGSDIRKLHYSGFYGSTLEYLMRHKSQRAWWADKQTYRASMRDQNGRRRGIKSPIIGKRWGCTRNISSQAIDAFLAAKAEARAAARETQRAA